MVVPPRVTTPAPHEPRSVERKWPQKAAPGNRKIVRGHVLGCQEGPLMILRPVRWTAFSSRPDWRSSIDALCGRHRESGWELLRLRARSAGLRATGATVDAVEDETRAAIRFHIDGLKADGLPVFLCRPALRIMWTSLP